MTLASELNERVRIEQANMTDDGFGGKNVSWSEVATVFAKVTPVQTYARERTIADQPSAAAGYRLTIRNRDDVDASKRFVWNGRTLGIHSLHETRATLEILTYEENV